MMMYAHAVDDRPRTEDIQISEDLTFSGLLLSDRVLRGLTNSGFVRPSPIQLEAIPLGKCGLDLIVQAKSGTGKTCVVAVIALEMVEVKSKFIQILVLTPTREIAVQVSQVISSIGSSFPGLKCAVFIGGIQLAEDKEKLKHCHIAVGTPGRIKQLISEGLLRTDTVRLFVLDEADKLLDESFQENINWIFHKLPSSKQMLALSATYPESLAQLLKNYMQDPTFVRLNASHQALLGIKHFYKVTPHHPVIMKNFEHKVSFLLRLLSSLPFKQCLVFSNYQLRAQSLNDKLNSHGWPAACITGSQEQHKRLRTISDLKAFRCRVLISTDLTSRGIDAENVNLVVNLDVPWDAETYLHRVGRAGRFGSHGIAVNLVSSSEEKKWLSDIITEIGINVTELPDELSADLWIQDVDARIRMPAAQIKSTLCVSQHRDPPLLNVCTDEVNITAEKASAFTEETVSEIVIQNRHLQQQKDSECEIFTDEASNMKLDFNDLQSSQILDNEAFINAIFGESIQKPCTEQMNAYEVKETSSSSTNQIEETGALVTNGIELGQNGFENLLETILKVEPQEFLNTTETLEMVMSNVCKEETSTLGSPHATYDEALRSLDLFKKEVEGKNECAACVQQPQCIKPLQIVHVDNNIHEKYDVIGKYIQNLHWDFAKRLCTAFKTRLLNEQRHEEAHHIVESGLAALTFLPRSNSHSLQQRRPQKEKYIQCNTWTGQTDENQFDSKSHNVHEFPKMADSKIFKSNTDQISELKEGKSVRKKNVEHVFGEVLQERTRRTFKNRTLTEIGSRSNAGKCRNQNPELCENELKFREHRQREDASRLGISQRKFGKHLRNSYLEASDYNLPSTENHTVRSVCDFPVSNYKMSMSDFGLPFDCQSFSFNSEWYAWKLKTYKHYVMYWKTYVFMAEYIKEMSA